MKNLRPIYWHQGLFLQPQHLQLTDVYNQSLLSPYLKHLNPHLWGVSRLKLDEQALQEGALVVEEGEFIFPDGACVSIPGNGIVQPRSFDPEIMEQGKPFKVYLGLRKMDDSGENAAQVPNLEDLSGVTARFATSEDPEEVPDLHGDGPPANIKRMTYVIKIFWETERDQLSKYSLIPMQEAYPELDEVKLSDAYVPPSVQIDASIELLGTIKDIHDRVAARTRRLEEYKAPRGAQVDRMEPDMFYLIMGLRTLSRYLYPLSHLLDTRGVHPWSVYLLLSQFAGELTTFSSTVSATGEGEDGRSGIPDYDHDDLSGCFNRMREIISMLLDEITFGPEAVIRLNPEDSYYVGQIESSIFDPRNVFYLAIHSQKEKKEIIDGITSVAKLSARENLDILITRSLPGLELAHMPVPPPGLPQVSTTVYFKVDTSSPQWNDVRRLGNIALAWDNAPEDMAAEIIVLRRS